MIGSASLFNPSTSYLIKWGTIRDAHKKLRQETECSDINIYMEIPREVKVIDQTHKPQKSVSMFSLLNTLIQGW